MKTIIIIAMAFVLLIPTTVFAEYFITNEIADVLNSSPDYVNVSALSITSNNYEITWENNKNELEQILGKELFERYEPIVSVDAIYDSKTSTDLAFKELDNLLTILNDYSYEKYRFNHEIQIYLIKKMDFLSDEEKVDFIYDREIRNWNKIVSHYEYNNQKFVDQVKEFYLYLDEYGEIYQQTENAYQQEQEAITQLQKELESKEREEKQKIREELNIKEPKIICGIRTIDKNGQCVPDVEDSSPSKTQNTEVFDKPIKATEQGSDIGSIFSRLIEMLRSLFNFS